MNLVVLKAPYVLALAVAVATITPVSLYLSGYASQIGEQDIGTYDNAESRITDPKGDAVAVYQKEPGTDPPVRGYHDILSASVVKRGEAFFFTINLAGNPNNNDNYETLYRWHIVTTNPTTNSDQQYTIMFPNFGAGSNETSEGWYYAIFDETSNSFVVQPTPIPDMPEDRIEWPVEDFHIGNPPRFVYWVDVSVRLNSTFGEPDYLMDYAP